MEIVALASPPVICSKVGSRGPVLSPKTAAGITYIIEYQRWELMHYDHNGNCWEVDSSIPLLTAGVFTRKVESPFARPWTDLSAQNVHERRRPPRPGCLLPSLELIIITL